MKISLVLGLLFLVAGLGEVLGQEGKMKKQGGGGGEAAEMKEGGEASEGEVAPADVVPSEELIESLRGDLVRGELIFPMGNGVRKEKVHWDEYAWPFKAERWGMYWVDVRYYGLRKAMGAQARFRSDKMELVKGFLKPGGKVDKPKTVRLGKLYLVGQGDQELMLLTPEDDPIYDFKLVSVQLVPAPEGEEVVRQDAESGEVVLLAKDATTDSVKMRYEPKEEKQCLGFWTNEEDSAQWVFGVTKPGTFEVVVTQGCGSGQGGSVVEVSVGDDWAEEFEVKDTGGFQNWEEVSVGEVEIAEAGERVLRVQPKTKAAKAVLDVNRVVLKPVE
ncbi:MAG: hypothetical protein AAF591_06295 [Verrucomicrobiota bacterium]